MKKWLLGCLNSAIKQSTKLALVILAAFTTGGHLDIKTLAYSVSVGFIWGVVEWASSNPLPDPSTTVLVNLPPAGTSTVNLKDKIDS